MTLVRRRCMGVRRQRMAHPQCKDMARQSFYGAAPSTHGHAPSTHGHVPPVPGIHAHDMPGAYGQAL